MKRIFSSLLVTFAILTIQACSKEKSAEPVPPEILPEHPWAFEANGIQYMGNVDLVTLDTANAVQVMTIMGTDTASQGQIQLLISSTEILPGVYQSPVAAFNYSEEGNPVYSSGGIADNFTITITDLNELEVKGNFSGTIQNEIGETFALINGSFSGLR